LRVDKAAGRTQIQAAAGERAMSDLNIIRRDPAGKSGKPPVLFVHGAWHGAWCWEDNFLPFFAENGHRACAVDLRGHGASPAAKAMLLNRIRDYVDDVASVVKTFDRPPVVIGHSMGGLVCQHLAHRGLGLAGIGLLSTVPSYGVWKTTASIALRRPVDFLKANLTLSLYPLVADPADARHMFIEDDTPDAETRAFAARLTDESYLAFLDMLLFALPPRRPVSVPMLVIGGADDTIFSVASQRHTARFYGCDCHIVDGVPHDGMLSRRWKQVAGIFLDWIDEAVTKGRQSA
jgi:pimeloyl-ACP methyl ester carboxylesterase